MINKIALISICSLVVGVGLCVAQSNESIGDAHWGKSVQGVHLSITMTNNVFPAGLSSVVTSVTENLSANPITVDMSAPTVNFDVLLISDTGKLYHVTTQTIIILPRKLVIIGAGEKSIESIPVTFSEEIEPGDYTLKATRKFTLNGKEYKLESNSIKVTIVK